jgi:hypothetical protein
MNRTKANRMQHKTVDTKKAAEFLGCSPRRVRVLLAQGRITAEKVNKVWLIRWPIQCTFGLRAPLRKFSHNRTINNKTKKLNESEV